MKTKAFFEEMDARIAKYDLLCHPFYKAWSAGELTREDLREYGQDYFHHVAEFPEYLREFAARVEDDQLNRAVMVNREDELGLDGSRPHPELWLDFVAGGGGGRGGGGAPAKENGGGAGGVDFLGDAGGAPREGVGFFVHGWHGAAGAAEDEKGGHGR